MITRMWPGGYLSIRKEPVPDETNQLEDEGYAVRRSAFKTEEIAALASEIESVYDEYGADDRGSRPDSDLAQDFRYEMFNRSALSQSFVGRREILDVIEPLIGEDCHVIANTCWRNPPCDVSRHGGGGWHIDAGPHIPLADGQSWPTDLPHPVFAIGVHLYLEDCPIECGPTAVIPNSHRSGRPPPQDRRMDSELTWNDNSCVALTANAGDVAFFVSDVWHRRLPPSSTHKGRFFLQIHYGRRDIAQRVKPTSERNHIDETALGRIATERERYLFGLHNKGFYDG